MNGSSDLPFAGSERFQVKERLGAGGMGVVYRAHDKVRRADVALKTLRSLDGVALYRFKNEFRALAGIVHDNLVTLYELLSQGEEWFFTMELVEGVPFIQHVRPYEHLLPPTPASDPLAAITESCRTSPTEPSQGPAVSDQLRRNCLAKATLNRDRLCASLVQLTRGVRALHRAGKLHRDLKPSNVLVNRHGRVVVCDFGLVAEVDARPAGADKVQVMGTPAYMSPEQAGGQPLRESSDWYSLGVMLYEALTGRVPFTGAPAAMLREKQSVDAEPPRRWNEAIDGDLNDLCSALLRRDPTLRPAAEDILAVVGAKRPSFLPTPAPAVPQGPPFVGRETHVAALSEALQASQEGRSVAVFVHGPSGMGKTALVARFLGQLAGSADTVVLEGRCYERESVPYKALDGLVDALSNLLVQMPPEEVRALVPKEIGSLARIFPVLRRIDVLREALPQSQLPPDPQELRSRAFGALREMLGRVAGKKRTIVYIDDLQWGDIDSAFFLVDLIHLPDSPRLLFIGSYRIDEVETSPLLQTLVQRKMPTGVEGDVRMLEVGALSREESRHLALAVLDDSGEQAQRRADEVAREAGGNPFFVVELARVAGEPGAGAFGGRLNLDDVLRRRITDLPDDARALLTASAVAGRPTAVSVVSRAAGIEDEPAALAVLSAARMVRTLRVGDVEEIEPYHDKIRQSAIGRLSEMDLRRFHRRLARSFESSELVDPLALVEHWIGAGVRERAGHYAVLAAAQAEATMAFDRAAYHYGLALELRQLDTEARSAMQVRMADALRNAGSLGEAAKAYLLAAEGVDGGAALDLRRRALEQLLRSGREEEGLALAREVLHGVGLKLPRGRAGALLSVVASRLRLAVRGLEFKARPDSEITADDIRRLDVFWSVGSGLSLVDPMLGTAFQMRNLVAALRVGEPYRAALALSMEVGFRSYSGGRARSEVLQLAASTRSLAEQSGNPHAIAVCMTTTGLARFSMGDFEEARESFEEAEERFLQEALPGGWDLGVCRQYHMAALWYLGRIGELTRRVLVLLRESVERGDEFLTRGLRVGRSNAVWLVLDQPDEARRQLESAGVAQRERGFHMVHYYELLAQCQIDLYCGDGDAAWQRLDSAWRQLKRSMLVRRAESIRISAQFLRARCALAAAASSRGNAGDYLREALGEARALQREKNHWNLGKAALIRGCAAGLRGERDAAIPELELAAERLEANGMALHAAVARRCLGLIVGDDRGDALVASADAWMKQEGILRPARMAEMLAPGVGSARHLDARNQGGSTD